MQLKTRIRSTVMRLIGSERSLNFRRRRARVVRMVRGQGPRVDYFHQVDDPYSHLAVQRLDALKARYRLPFRCHLVSGPGPEYQGDSSRFASWALKDARSVASGFDVSLPEVADKPDSAQVQAATDRLAPHLQADDFGALAFETGEMLWRGEPLPEQGADAAAAVRAGNELRDRLGHYQGAMFYFDGEWFWGLDRLHLLEARLSAEGFDRTAEVPPCAPLPVPPALAGRSAVHVTLEYFPSLRSPYTAVGHAGLMDLVARSGVTLVTRPVMPMMMRGVPAPVSKQLYILTDAAREARWQCVPFGRFVDPFGEPVRRAFALFPGALAAGRPSEFVGAYLSAAFAEGIDITTESGLSAVAENAGLEYGALLRAAADGDCERLLEENLNAMLEAGLWGVPSFRVTSNAAEPFSCWGQDRIWRVEAEIVARSVVESKA